MAEITEQQERDIATLLMDLDVILISLKNIALQLERDVLVDGGIKWGVAWNSVVAGLADQGREMIEKAQEALPGKGDV